MHGTQCKNLMTDFIKTYPLFSELTDMIIDPNSTRIINGMEHKVTTADGLDRVQINERLNNIREQLEKLQNKQSDLLAMRDAIDYECEMRERADSADDLFAQMFNA